MSGRSKPKMVVVGMGAYTPLGPDVSTTFNNLASGVNGIALNEQFITDFPQYADEAPLVANSPPIILENFERRRLRETDVKTARVHEGVLGLLKVIGEAGVQAGIMDPETLQFDKRIKPNKRGVIIATGIGGATVIGEAKERMRTGKILGNNPILQALPGRGASVSAKYIEAHGGYVEGILGECAGSLMATGNALDQLRSGRVDVVFAGGTEGPIVDVSNGMFHGTSALAKSQNPLEAPRPFDDDSPGTVLGGGACVLVMMREKDAIRLGVKPLAEVVGYYQNNDAWKDTAPSGPEGQECMREAVKMAESRLGERLSDTLVMAHGTGAPVGDEIEADNINVVLEGHSIAGVKAPKDQLGHLGGASGGAATIMGIKAMEKGILLGSPKGRTRPNQHAGWDMPEKSIDRNIGSLMVNAFGFTGYNACMVLVPYR